MLSNQNICDWMRKLFQSGELKRKSWIFVNDFGILNLFIAINLLQEMFGKCQINFFFVLKYFQQIYFAYKSIISSISASCESGRCSWCEHSRSWSLTTLSVCLIIITILARTIWYIHILHDKKKRRRYFWWANLIH